MRSDLTFLDLTVQQIEFLNKKYNTNVPLVLMNSFNTDEDTMKIIRKYSGFNISIRTFNQSCYPRISKESMMPVAKSSRIEDDLGKKQDIWRNFSNILAKLQILFCRTFKYFLNEIQIFYHNMFRLLVPAWPRRLLPILLQQRATGGAGGGGEGVLLHLQH